MDALPIREQTGLPFASRNEGVMHACGHDMHIACLLGALILLNRRRSEIDGTVCQFFFSRAKRWIPAGQAFVLAEDPFCDYRVQAVVGEHVGAEISLGQLGFRPGKYIVSGDEVRITVRGRGGHGALPHNLNDPVVAAAALITALQQVVSRNIDSRVPSVLSFGRVIADGATNIIPSEVRLEGTFRDDGRGMACRGQNGASAISAGVAAAYGVEADVDIADGYPCVVNDPELTRRAQRIAAEMWGDERIIPLDLRMTAEGFGCYTERYPSLFSGSVQPVPTERRAEDCVRERSIPGEGALDQGAATMAAFGMASLE